MVRSKSTPCKSLPIIDWNHPSFCFWFFGKSPSDEKNRYDFFREKKKKGQDKKTDSKLDLQHPLASHPEIPALTDLQTYITEAILSSKKNNRDSADFETISEYVSKRWRNIKRRDGSSYATDCRRAIQANLRHNPNHIPLFRKDKNFQDHWTLCKTIEEAEQVFKERSAKKKSRAERETKENRVEQKQEKKETIPQGQVENEQEQEDEASKKKELKEESPPPKKTEDNQEETIVEENKQEEQVKKITLEELICECINDNSGSCHFDLILHHVIKNRNRLIKDTEDKDLKSMVLQSLLFSKNLFKRDSKKIGWWILYNQNENANKRETRSKTARKERESSPEKSTGETHEEDATSKSRDPPMTELQVLIIEGVSKHGGTANFEQIYEHVSKSFENLRRRNGMPYTSDCKRAIQASLSNNPPTRPFFKVKRDQKKGLTTWTLAKRSLEFLEEKKKSDALKSPKEKEKSNEEDDPISNEEKANGSDCEEEILDEELSIDEEDIKELERDIKEQETSEKTKSTNEEKCFYPNRLKRAKQLKEKARLEQSMKENERPNKRRRSKI